MNKNNLKQILSASLSLALAVTSAPMPAGAIGPVAAPEPAFVARFTPPEKFGYVASSYSPQGAERPRLIVIADLHGHLEVQKNIMGMMDHLVNLLRDNKPNAAKVPVFLEGAWKSDMEEPLRDIKSVNQRSFFKEYFLQKSEYGAAQAYSEMVAGQGKVSLIGVENEQAYKANKAQFVKTYPFRKKILEGLIREEAALRTLSSYISNKSFTELQRTRDDYFAGRVSPERYARLLVRQARRYKIHGQAVETLCNVATASPKDLDVAFANVYRLVSARASEGRPWTSFLRQSLGDEGDLRAKIAAIDAEMDLLKRLVGNQLTPAEVPMALAHMAALVKIAEALLANEKLDFNVGDAVRQSLVFYPYAIERDTQLAENSLAALNKAGPETSGILVVGGFHVDAIGQYLREHHVAYLQLNPSITRDLTSNEQLNYVKRMCDEHISSAELDADLKVLRGGQARRTQQSAIGPSTNIIEEAPGSGKVDKMMNGLTPQQLASIAADQNLAATLGAATNPLVGAVVKEDVGVPEARGKLAQSLLDAYNADPKNADKKIDLNLEGRDGITLNLDEATGKYTAPKGAEGYADFVNAGIAEQRTLGTLTEKLPAQMHMLIVEQDETGKLNALAGILGRGTNAPVTLVNRTSWDVFNKLHQEVTDGKVELGSAKAEAYMRALSVVVHEAFGHITNKAGHDEGSAIVEGMQLAAILAIRAFTSVKGPGTPTAEAVANSFLTAFSPYVVGAKDDAGNLLFATPNKLAPEAWRDAVPELATAIANLINPQRLSEVQQQEVVRILKDRFPNLTEYYLAQKVKDEQNSFHRMMGGGEGGDNPGPGDGAGKPNADPAAAKAADNIIAESGQTLGTQNVTQGVTNIQQ